MIRQIVAAATVLAITTFLVAAVARGQDSGGQPKDLGQIPPAVIDALKAKFPKADIDKWTREKEGEEVIYDLEFRVDGTKYEADITEAGRIDNWEKQVSPEMLPEAVRQAVEQRHPKATIREVMQMTTVKAGTDVPEGFEIVLETAEKKTVELSVAPDGKILEDTPDEPKKPDEAEKKD